MTDIERKLMDYYQAHPEAQPHLAPEPPAPCQSPSAADTAIAESICRVLHWSGIGLLLMAGWLYFAETPAEQAEDDYHRRRHLDAMDGRAHETRFRYQRETELAAASRKERDVVNDRAGWLFIGGSLVTLAFQPRWRTWKEVHAGKKAEYLSP